jgi:hypothetical protein
MLIGVKERGRLGLGLYSRSQYFTIKISDSKYFKLHRPNVSVTTTQICYCREKAATDNTKMSECGWVSIKLYLQTQAIGWL